MIFMLEAYILKANIGIESQLYHKVLSHSKTFKENVLEAINKFKRYQFQSNPLTEVQNNSSDTSEPTCKVL